MKTLKAFKWIAACSLVYAGLISCQKEIPETPVLIQDPVVSLSDLKAVENANYYVSPGGSDSNPGTINQPFKSIEKAYSVAAAGMLIYFRGGTYKPLNQGAQVSFNFAKGKNGAWGKLIRFWAYPGESVVIDLSSLTHTGGTIWGVSFTGNYWHWKGFEIKGLPNIVWKYNHTAFMAYACNNCIFENLKIHDNNAMGFCLAGASTNNLVLNSDSYRNQDAGTSTDPYGNADGFHIGPMTNTSNVNTIQGCRSWSNSDDGYDMYNNEGTVNLVNCYSFSNGYRVGTTTKAGDGVGFKLGNSNGAYASVKRVLAGCISANNRMTGFDLNDGNFAVKMDKCKSFNNHNHGIYLNKYSRVNLIYNCVSISSGSGYNALVTSQSTIFNCSWKGFSVSASNFVSTDISLLSSTRNTDGSLPTTNFMVLKSASVFQYR